MTGETEGLFQELTNLSTSGMNGFLCSCGVWVKYREMHSCYQDAYQRTGATGYTCTFCQKWVAYGQMHACLFQDQRIDQVIELLHKICDKLGISYYLKGSVEEFLTDVMGEENSMPVEELMKLVTCGCGIVKEFNTDDGWHCTNPDCDLGDKDAI